MENLRNIVVETVKDAVTVNAPKGQFVKMTNRRSYGLSFCSAGQITYTHNGKSFVSDNKHVIIIPEGQSYTLRCDKAGAFPLIDFSCSKPLCDTFMLFPVENIDVLMNDFKSVKKLIMFSESHAKVMSIFYNMINNIIPENNFCSTIAPAISYIKDNYRNAGITNEVLAKECGISEIYLRKLFTRHLNLTPRQYISEMRLQKAKQLLSEGVLKISSISEECGFESSYNFSRFFKEKTGVSPTDYMKQNRIYKI